METLDRRRSGLHSSSRPGACAIGAIVATVLSALWATTAALAREDPKLERPEIRSVVITPDSVWFCPGGRGTGDPRPYYLWIRQSDTWRNGVSSAAACLTARQDTRGVGVATVAPAPGREQPRPTTRSRLIFIDSATGRRIDLTPPVDAKVTARIQGMGMAPDTISARVSAMFVDDTIAWLGLAGGFGEATDAEFGGLYRVDRRTGAFTFTLDDTLQEHPSPLCRRPRRGCGLGRRSNRNTDLAAGRVCCAWTNGNTGAWRSYTDRNSPMPNTPDSHARVNGHLLAIATDGGLSRT